MNSGVPAWGWIALGITVLVLLVIDLLAHRHGHGASRKSAIVWTIVWVCTGLGFNIVVWATMGSRAGQEYLAAYLIEKSLSVDNLFVFLIVFGTLNVPAQQQHRVLFWGIFGALIFRAIFIFLGVAALEKAQWVVYVFGAVLLYGAWRAFRDDPAEDKESRSVKWLSKRLPVTSKTHADAFIARENGRLVATPLLIALIAIELTDIVFAIDSVPAALSVSRDQFIVYSSNAFAILGLRALYTVMAQTLLKMRFLHYGLAAVLAFAAIKLITSQWIELSPALSIGIIVLMIGASVVFSVRAKKREERHGKPVGRPPVVAH
jgi:tellurite resistance protein TerC